MFLTLRTMLSELVIGSTRESPLDTVAASAAPALMAGSAGRPESAAVARRDVVLLREGRGVLGDQRVDDFTIGAHEVGDQGPRLRLGVPLLDGAQSRAAVVRAGYLDLGTE